MSMLVSENLRVWYLMRPTVVHLSWYPHQMPLVPRDSIFEACVWSEEVRDLILESWAWSEEERDWIWEVCCWSEEERYTIKSFKFFISSKVTAKIEMYLMNKQDKVF